MLPQVWKSEGIQLEVHLQKVTTTAVGQVVEK